MRKIKIERRSGGVFFKILFGLIALCIFIGGLLAFTNIGGDMVLNLAKKTLREQAGLELNASGISGNPIKGYALNDLEILDLKNNKKILSSEELNARLDLAALMRGLIRVIVHDSVINTEYGTFNISRVSAALKGENAQLDLDGKLNGVKITGEVDADIKNSGESDKNIIINKANIKPGSGNVTATGQVALKDLNLNINGSAQGINFQEIAEMLKFLDINKSDFDGAANINFEASGKADPQNLKINGTLNYKGKKIMGYPVERVSSNFVYTPNKINVNNLQASLFNIPISGEASASLKNNQPDFINIKLDGRATNLDGFVKDLKGRVSAFNVNIQGGINSLNGNINFNAPNISYQNYKINNIIANLKLANSDKANVSGKFNFENAQGYLQGDIASILKNPKLNLTAKLVDLDIKRVAGMIPDASQYNLSGNVTAALNITGSASNPKISGSINSAALSGMGQKLTKPQVDFSFANNTLSINKSAGNLNGMPINLTGKIANLTAKNPDINIDAGVTVSPAALKTFAPDIDSYALKGNINAAVKIRGKLPSPNINLAASAPNISALNNINIKNFELNTALNGDLSKLNNLNADIKAGSLSAGGLNFNNLNAKLTKTGDNINLTGLNAKSDAGNFSLNGTINTAKKDPVINFAIKGDALDLAKLTNTIPDLKGQLNGRADLDFKLSGAASNLNGTGSLKSSALKAFDINLTDVNLPLVYSGAKNSLSSQNGTAKAYGGAARNNFNLDLKTMKFTEKLEASELNVNNFIRDTAGNIGGNIGGKGKLTLNLSGSAANGVKYSGDGTFSMGTGAITGFKWLDLATKLYNSKGVNYLNINAPFTIQTGKLILNKTSAANANKNDPLYKYARLTNDGVINFNDPKNITLNITADLNVNYQLINALIGGGKGGLEALLGGNAKNIQEGLLQILGGGLKGAKEKGSVSDYRTITVKISGKAASPSFSIVKIGDTTIKEAENKNNNKNNQNQAANKNDNKADNKAQGAKNAQQTQNNKPSAKNVKENVKNNVKNAQNAVKTKASEASKKAAEKLVDAILPTNKKNTKNNSASSTAQQAQQNQNTQQIETKAETQNSASKSRENELKDKLKEELAGGIQKGLGNLFKKKK